MPLVERIMRYAFHVLIAAAVLVNADGEEVSTVVGIVQEAKAVPAAPELARAEVSASEQPAKCIQM